MHSQRDFRNSLWNKSQRDRATALLSRVRHAQSHEHHAPITPYGAAVDSLTDALTARRVVL